MICKRCGSTINDEHGCIYCITSEQTKISEDGSVQMQETTEVLSLKNKEKWPREETIIISFGVIVAVFLVGITILNAIF